MKIKKMVSGLIALFFLVTIILVPASCKKSSDNSGTPSAQTPVVTTSAISNITERIATCGGTVVSAGGSAVTARGVCYSTQKNPSIADLYITDEETGIGSFVSLILGLTPNTSYHIRSYATNSAGTAYGADSSFTTAPGVLLDGYYIKGAGTAYTDLNETAIMKVTKNEVTGTNRSHLLELYIPVKAGVSGFNIVKVAGSVQTVYGPGTGFGTVTNPKTDEPRVPFQRGPVIATSAVFTVSADGLYHVVFDVALNIGVVAPVHWGMIGAAVPSGWPISTDMPESAFNLTNMSWTISNLAMTIGEWRFRYCNGWKIILDTVYDNGGGQLGVKVNTNLGGALSTLEPGGYNILNSIPGVYTCLLNYNMISGYTVTLTKTGNIPPIDYSTYQMGIIGNCYLKADGVTQANWDENFGSSLPVVTGGTTYFWTYNININEAGDFKFRQGNDWSGKSIGYNNVTMAGPAANNFIDDGGNFQVIVTGNYTLVLQIDALTENYTVTATKN